MGRVLSLLALLLLAACAGVAPQVEGGRTIGIVSAIGDKFYLRKVGFTVFGNESEEMAIDSWGIDDLMTAKLKTALAGRFRSAAGDLPARGVRQLGEPAGDRGRATARRNGAGGGVPAA